MKISIIIFSCLIALNVVAQSKEETKAKAALVPVEMMFEGMRTGDSAMVHSAFMNHAKMYTAYTNKEGVAVLREGSLKKFLTAVGTPHDDIWNEPFWGAKVNIDGNLAQVWVNYAFYMGKSFSHCGVDAFHLFYNGKEWKIFHITDTRQRNDCIIPDEIKARYK